MATKGFMNRISSINGEQISDYQSFAYADNTAQYTVKKLEFDFSDANTNYKRQYHMVSVFNPSTECDLTVRVFAEIGHDIKRLVQIDSFTGTKMGAVSNPTMYYYYDASATTYTSDLTDATNATDDDVVIPGHAAGEVGDFMMIGSTLSPFNQLIFNVTTANTDERTLVFEYLDTDGTWNEFDSADTDFDQTIFDATGVSRINFNTPSDWGVYDPAVGAGGGDNPTTGWYVRIRCSVFTAAGTQGLADQVTMVKSAIYGPATSIDIEQGVGLEYDRVVVTVENAGAAVSAAKTVAGVGGFTGYVSVTQI